MESRMIKITSYVAGMAIVAALVFINAPTDIQLAKVLEDQNYANIVIHGYSYFGCGQDVYSYSFTATRLDNGRTVNGYLCSGIMKGYTTRLEE